MKVIKTIFLSLLLSQIVLGQYDEMNSPDPKDGEEDQENPDPDDQVIPPNQDQDGGGVGDQSIEFQCQKDGYYPNPKDSSKFIRCVDGTPYYFDCAPGTVWDTQKEVCDMPSFLEQDVYPKYPGTLF